MNKQLQDFARNAILKGVKQLPKDWQQLFKRLYSHDNLTISIDALVANMPEEKLDWAMQQIEQSLEKIKKEQKKENHHESNTNL